VTVHCTVVLTELAKDESLDAFPPAAHSARDFVLRAIGPASIRMTSQWAAAAHTAIRGSHKCNSEIPRTVPKNP